MQKASGASFSEMSKNGHIPVSSDSLIPSGEQLELIPSSQIDDGVFVDFEKRGHFTGERLAVRDPVKYAVIVSLLGEGLGVKTIAKLARVSPHTCQAVRQREAATIDTLKKKTAARARGIAGLCLDRIEELLLSKRKIELRELSIAFGVTTEKAELLDGNATARIDVTDGQPGHRDLIEYLERLRTEASETDCGVENPGQRTDGQVVEGEIVTADPGVGDDPGADQKLLPPVPDDGCEASRSDRVSGTNQCNH